MIVHNRQLREHPDCFGSWNFGGPPVLVDGLDLRLQRDDLPAWVLAGAPDLFATRLQIFNDLMTLWRRIIVAPFLPFVLVNRVRENGDGGGVQFAARFECHFDVVSDAMPSFLEEVSEQAMEYLRDHDYGSLIHMIRVTAQDYCAILFGPGKFAEHRC